MKPLVIIPVYVRTEEDVEVTMTAVRSVRKTQGQGVELLLVDDGSPDPGLIKRIYEQQSGELQFEYFLKPQNEGFSKTVNVGLQRAFDSGQDAVLMNADVELKTTNWYRHFKNTTDEKHRKAAVAGALLVYPNGLIQHGGIYFSLLTRTFDHYFKFSPQNLPEALEKRVCPVTAALQYIRHSTLETVGLYDEKFKMGWEDVDYCIRVFLAGLTCVYNPNVIATHYEQMFRGRPDPKIAEWQDKSYMYLLTKYANQNFSDFVPFW